MKVYLRLLCWHCGMSRLSCPQLSAVCKPQLRCIDHFTKQKAFSYIAYHAAFGGGSVCKVSDEVFFSSLQGEVFLCSLRPMYRLEDPRSLLPNRCLRVKRSKRDASQVSPVSKSYNVWGFNATSPIRLHCLLCCWSNSSLLQTSCCIASLTAEFYLLDFKTFAVFLYFFFGWWFLGVWILCADV
jgi:hypothetical protein